MIWLIKKSDEETNKEACSRSYKKKFFAVELSHFTINEICMYVINMQA